MTNPNARTYTTTRDAHDHTAHEVGLAASTVQSILRAEGMARLDDGDQSTAEPVWRHQRDRPGELIHVDIKRIAAIPNGVGWRHHGRGNDATKGRSGVGYRYIHTALDDRSRVAYSEILNDEKAVTAVVFWARAAAWFAQHGITCERVITVNGSCYRSQLWHQACAETHTKVKKTRPRRPQDQRKSGALPSDPAQKIGLHPALGLRNPTPPRLHALL